MTEGVQTEVQHLLDKLALLLPPAGKAPDHRCDLDPTAVESGYNWLFVQGDGSLGVHNTAYAVGLLKASIADMTAKK